MGSSASRYTQITHLAFEGHELLMRHPQCAEGRSNIHLIKVPNAYGFYRPSPTGRSFPKAGTSLLRMNGMFEHIAAYAGDPVIKLNEAR
jgi:hypothetical protein